MSNQRQRIFDSGDVPRRKLHVCKGDAGNADYLYDNLPSGTLFHSVAQAAKSANAFDDIIVWPGEWTEDATINLDKEGLRLRGFQVGYGAGLASAELWQYAGTNTPVVTVAAKGVEICGLQILPYNDVTAVGIAVGLAVESKYCYIHDNYLRAINVANGPTLISVGTEDTYDAQMCMIHNNYFRKGGSQAGTSAQILIGQGTGSSIINNNFLLAGSSTGWNSVQLSDADVQRIIVQRNLFMAFEGGACLVIDPGQDSETQGHMYISENDFIGFADNDALFEYDANNAGTNRLGGTVMT